MESKFWCMRAWFLFLLGIVSVVVTSLADAETHYHDFVVRPPSITLYLLSYLSCSFYSKELNTITNCHRFNKRR